MSVHGLPHGVTFRPIHKGDMGFLSRLYGSTRQQELAATGWNDQEKAQFLAMQFRAQHDHYQRHFPEARYQVIELHQVPVGRLYLDERAAEFRLLDIALLPEHRNRGIGSAILNRLLDEAARLNRPIRIHVEHFNPALRLYQRLGFSILEDRGVYHFMEWRAPTS